MIYFDNAATSRKKPEEVYEAFNYYIREVGTSPGRGSYSLAIQASRMLYQSRKTVSSFFGGVNPNNVVFTKNSTEAINLFFNGFLKKGDHVLISPYEHNAVLRPLHRLKEKGVIDYTVLPEDVLYCRADFRHHPKRRKAQRKFALYNPPDCGSIRAVLRATADTVARRKSASGSLEKTR